MRACTTCLCALSPAPLPMPNASRKYTPCASAPKRRRPIACRRRERTPPALPPERPSCCEGLSQIAEECDRGRGAIAAPAGIDLESDQPVSPESHMVAQQVHQAPGKARRRSTSSRDRTAPPPNLPRARLAAARAHSGSLLFQRCHRVAPRALRPEIKDRHQHDP